MSDNLDYRTLYEKEKERNEQTGIIMTNLQGRCDILEKSNTKVLLHYNTIKEMYIKIRRLYINSNEKVEVQEEIIDKLLQKTPKNNYKSQQLPIFSKKSEKQ